MKYLLSILFVLGLGLAILLFPVPDTSSPEYHSWKKEHDLLLAQQSKMAALLMGQDFKFNDVELIHVGPGPAYFSKWGHLMLRFKGSAPTLEDDLTLGFLADFNEFPYSRYKSIFGGYTVLPKLDTLSNYRVKYQQIENRTMDFYLLESSAPEREKLLRTLKQWLTDPRTPGTYTFFSNNCVGLMNRLLFESGIFTETQLRDGYFPDDLPPLLKKKG